MKIEWTVLLISAFTDFIITFGTGLTVGNAATETTYPTGATLLYSAIGGLIQFARTVQQALKTSPATTAALKGETTETVTKTRTTATPTATDPTPVSVEITTTSGTATPTTKVETKPTPTTGG